MRDYFWWYSFRLNVRVTLLHFNHRPRRDESWLVYFYLWWRLLLFVDRVLNEIRIDLPLIWELSALLVLRLVNIGVKLGSLELIEGLFYVIFGYLTVGIDFASRYSAFLLLADSPSLWNWRPAVLYTALFDWLDRLWVASHVWGVHAILFSLEGAFLKGFARGKLGFYWSSGMFGWLEVASDCLEALFIVILVFFDRGNVVVGEVTALFLTDLWGLFDCNVLFFGLFCFLVFIEDFIVHFDEIQSFIWHLQSFLILLYIFGNIANFLPNSGFCLVLILLQNFLLALGWVVINRRIDL